MKIREALLSMGYSEEKPKKWLKPIGWNLLTFEEETFSVTSWFKSMTGQLMVFSTKKLEDNEEFIFCLKEFEAYGRYNVGSSISSFEMPKFDL